MNAYQNLADFYDRLTLDIDYKGIAEFTLKACETYRGGKPGILLDLACGTGSLAIELAKAGTDVIGIDISPQMLSRAYSKSRDAGLDILFIEQDMCDFELYGTVDVITCYLDSINHIIDRSGLYSLFRLAANYLNPGGLFIFDFNTKYCFEKIYSDNVFYESFDDLTCIWQNRYDSKLEIADFDMTFFIRMDNGMYTRIEDRNRERYYPEEEYRRAAELVSLKTVAAHDSYSFRLPQKNSPRILHVVKKPECLLIEKASC